MYVSRIRYTNNLRNCINVQLTLQQNSYVAILQSCKNNTDRSACRQGIVLSEGDEYMQYPRFNAVAMQQINWTMEDCNGVSCYKKIAPT